MTKKVVIGAPSRTGKDANSLVAEAFGEAEFPLQIFVRNHLPRPVVFPEIEGLHLAHVAAKEGTRKAVTIKSLDLFHRVASSIEQVAELNDHAKAITIADSAEGLEDDELAADPAPTAQGTAAPAGGAPVPKRSEGLSYEQIKDELKTLGIEFSASAKKIDLAALLDAAPAVPAAAADGDGSVENNNPDAGNGSAAA